MFSSFCNIGGTDVYHRTANGLRRGDDHVVILCDLKSVEGLSSRALVENTRINGIGDRIVDEGCEDEAILTFFENLHSIGRDGIAGCVIGVVFNNLVRAEYRFW
jgi:hypothetical protein